MTIIIDNILNNHYSILLYFSIITLVSYFGFLAEKNKLNRQGLIYIIICVLILSIFSGMRGINVGADTRNYVTHIRYGFEKVNSYRNEPGLYFIIRISQIFIQNVNFTLVLIALTINGLIFLRLWTMRNSVSLSYSTFTYLTLFYLHTFSGIRQWLAISIVFYATYYLFENKYILFLISILLATLFHKSALIMLPIMLIFMIVFKEKNKILDYCKNKLYVILFLLVLFVLIISFLNKYQVYIFNLERTSGSGIFGWLKLIIISALYIHLRMNNFYEDSSLRKSFLISFIGSILVLPGFYYKNIARIALYYNSSNILLYGMLFRLRDDKSIKKMLIIVSIFNISIFILEILLNTRIIPYEIIVK